MVNGKTTAKCKDCSTSVSAKSDRLRTHKQKCSARLVTKPSQKRPLDIEPEETVSHSPEVVPFVEPPTKRSKVQVNVDNYFVSTDAKTKSELEEEIAKTFYACNIPFNVASHPQFKIMIEKLCPGYQPPTRQALAGDLLNKISDTITTKMKSDIQGQTVTLIQDGWSDIHNTPVIASSIHTGDKSYFLSAVDTGANKKTKDYCASLANEFIIETSEKFNCSVQGLVTDNEKKMESTRAAVKETHPNIVVYGCGAHWANLLAQELTPSKVMCQLVEISKYFRNHHIPGALLADIEGSVKPQLPNDTRWSSQLNCLDTYIRNRPFMLLLIAQHEELIDSRITSLIQNIGLFPSFYTYIEVQNEYFPVFPGISHLRSIGQGGIFRYFPGGKYHSVFPITTLLKDKVAKQHILGKYSNCNSFGVTMDLLNSQNFKVAITQLFNVQQV